MSLNGSSYENNTNRTSVTGNDTTDAPLQPWTANTIVTVVTIITGVVSNVFLLSVFARQRSLFTPFNVYLINLLVANTCVVVLQYPLDIASSFGYPGWPYGYATCTFYLYIFWVLEAAMFNAHQLIAINRLWAVLHPMSYRTRHSLRVAVCMCAGMWVYVHLAALPIVILDAKYYRLTGPDIGCWMNGPPQANYNLALNVLLFCWPELVMWMTLPVVQVAGLLRQRKKQAAIAPSGSGFGTRYSDAAPPTDADDSTMVQAKSVNGPGRRRPRSNGTLLLICLTAAVTVTWTPLTVYFLMEIFVPNFDADYETFRFTALALFAFQATVDPVLFVCAVKPLQEAVRAAFTCRSGRS